MSDVTKIDAFDIKSKIHTIRDKQVMLDRDLAALYGVETKNLNRAVKRNIERFPKRYMFQLTKEEYENLRFQIGTSNHRGGGHGGNRYLPYAFTEQGVSMLSAVLRSKIAVEISIKIIDSFIAMRNLISSNDFFTQRLENVEKRQLSHEIKADENFNKIFKALETKTDIDQGIFYNGQIFDAHHFVADLIRKAERSIILIDNYIDDNTLTLFHKNQTVDVVIYTQRINKTLALDIEKYNKQYKPLAVKINKNFHDRFLIIDGQTYLIGASLKDLGKKVFGIALMRDIDLNLT